MVKRYAGWIPTVLGVLSFNLIGREGFPFPFIVKGDGLESGKVISVYQRRVPVDLNVYPILSKFIPIKIRLKIDSYISEKLGQPYIENFYTVFGGRECIKGYPLIIEGFVVKFKKVKNPYTALEDLSNIKIDWEKHGVKEIKDILFDTIKRTGVPYNAFDVTKFKLKRNGIIYFECDDQATASNCDNFYRFIKDIFHTHKHHHYFEDSLIGVVEIDPRVNFETIENDINWTDSIFRNMLRYVIRGRSYYGYNIIGILEYIKAFRSILEKCNEKEKGKKTDNETGEKETKKSKSKEYDTYCVASSIGEGVDNLKESIIYQLKCEDRKNSEKRWLLGVTLGIIYASYRMNHIPELIIPLPIIYSFVLMHSLSVIFGVKSFSYFLRDDLAMAGGVVNSILNLFGSKIGHENIPYIFNMIILLIGVMLLLLGAFLGSIASSL